MSKDIYHIASDYFIGRISEADKKYMQTWLDQSPDNAQVLSELEKVWKLTGKLYKQLEPDVDSEWSRFVQNRNQHTVIPSPESTRKKTMSLTLLRYAAIFIPSVLIIASILFLMLKDKPSTQEWVTLTTGTEKATQILPDGSEVQINFNSSLSYPKKFDKKERLVKLCGEAFFKVTKGKGPFIVDIAAAQVKVLGTEFNVRAYKKENSTEVQVMEGRVLFIGKNKNTIQAELVAGEKGILKENTHRIETGNMSGLNSLAWVTQTFHFNNTCIRTIGSDMSRYFNKTVKVDPALENCLFTGKFDHPEINEMLKIITLSLGCNFQAQNDTIYIYGNGCKRDSH